MEKSRDGKGEKNFFAKTFFQSARKAFRRNVTPSRSFYAHPFYILSITLNEVNGETNRLKLESSEMG